MNRFLTPLGCLVAPALCHAQASSVPAPQASEELDVITVTADPFADRSTLESLHPAEVLSGRKLDAARGGTLGETLNELPGVQAATFGAGASRPVIRGQGGPRVRIMDEGIGVIDASVISPDHNVASEPFRARQIEVLKGPATLLYGSGAIGGVVNQVCDLIETGEPQAGVEGLVGTRFSSVDEGDSIFGRVTGSNGRFSFHVDGLTRSTEDYDIPGFAESARLRAAEAAEEAEEGGEEGGEEEAEAFGTVPSTATETDSLAAGVTYTFGNAFVGVGFTLYDSLYGVPGPGHHGEEEEEGEAPGMEEEEEEGEESVELELEQRRYEVRAGWQGDGWLERARFDFAATEYEHTEFEIEGAERLTGTVFDNEGYEGRVELTHAPLSGWRGVFGVQQVYQDFSAIGDESFVPPVETTGTGVFLVEEREFAAWRLSVGLRAETVEHEASQGADRDFDLFGASLGVHRHLGEHHHLRISLGQAERAPDVLELYADGEHLATQTVEIGDPNLDIEEATHFDIGLAANVGLLDYSVDAFYTDYDNYIFAEQTGPVDDEGLTPIAYVQDGASFMGLEASVGYRVHESLRVGVFGDTVRAERDGGEDLPRIPADRIGLELGGTLAALSYRVRLTEVLEQTQATALEGDTDGYTLLSADLSYALPVAGSVVELSLRGRNLLDEEVRNHTSFLKELAPAPGANGVFEVQWRF